MKALLKTNLINSLVFSTWKKQSYTGRKLLAQWWWPFAVYPTEGCDEQCGISDVPANQWGFSRLICSCHFWCHLFFSRFCDMRWPPPLSSSVVCAHRANKRVHPFLEVWMSKEVSCFFTVTVFRLLQAVLASRESCTGHVGTHPFLVVLLQVFQFSRAHGRNWGEARLKCCALFVENPLILLLKNSGL